MLNQLQQFPMSFSTLLKLNRLFHIWEKYITLSWRPGHIHKYIRSRAIAWRNHIGEKLHFCGYERSPWMSVENAKHSTVPWHHPNTNVTGNQSLCLGALYLKCTHSHPHCRTLYSEHNTCAVGAKNIWHYVAPGLLIVDTPDTHTHTHTLTTYYVSFKYYLPPHPLPPFYRCIRSASVKSLNSYY